MSERNIFCKLFEHETIGQILCKKDNDDEGNPEIRFYCKPNGLGVCNLAIGFNCIEGSYQQRDAMFDLIDLDKAVSVIQSAIPQEFKDALDVNVG